MSTEIATRHYYAVEYAFHRDAVNPTFPVEVIVHRFDVQAERDERLAHERNSSPLYSRWRKVSPKHPVVIKARVKAHVKKAEWPVCVTMDSATEMGVQP